MLETVFVYTSFYEPRGLLAEGDAARALAVTAIAAILKPDHPRVCLNRARAHAQLGNRDEALEALRCAVQSGLVSTALVESDPYLEPLHDEAGYRAVLDGSLPSRGEQ